MEEERKTSATKEMSLRFLSAPPPQCLDNILYIHTAFVRVAIPFLWHKTPTKPENSFPFSLFAWARWQLVTHQPLAFS